MKNIIFLIFALSLSQSCVTNRIIKTCNYDIIITDEMIKLTKDNNTIWLSSYQGVKHKELKNKISMAGMPIDFTLTEENLRKKVFDDICWIDNKKLDSVIFFNFEDDNRLAYRLKYVK